MPSIFDNIPETMPEELFDTLCGSDKVRVERIVSRGHASAEGFWYEQDMHEFVVVLQGRAGLKFADKDDIIVLDTGEYLNIGARVKHRVEWTESTSDTIWLAVHYQ